MTTSINVTYAAPDNGTAGRRLKLIHVTPSVGVAVIDGHVHVWDGELEIRLGPLTADQLDGLTCDAVYEAEALRDDTPKTARRRERGRPPKVATASPG